MLKVISFKFNWTKRLGELCKKTSDEFNQIMKFYNNSEIDEPKSTNYNDSLFIEDELREYIDTKIFMIEAVAIARWFNNQTKLKTE